MHFRYEYVRDNDTEKITTFLLAKARLLLDLDDCIHISAASENKGDDPVPLPHTSGNLSHSTSSNSLGSLLESSLEE